MHEANKAMLASFDMFALLRGHERPNKKVTTERTVEAGMQIAISQQIDHTVEC
jgi:hypothetical protein